MLAIRIVILASILFGSAATWAEDKSLRIGIVGGGASGLSAAHYLKNAGYENVTVLERNDSVGGKTHTIEHGGRSYEMGAIMSGPSYTEVIQLAAETDQRIIDFAPGSTGLREYDTDSGRMAPLSMGKKIKFLAAALEYQALYRRYRAHFREPGLDRIPSELNVPFSEWAKANSYFPETLTELLSHTFVAFGYGYMTDVPAAYVLRYFSPALLRSFIFGRVHMLQNGYQPLFTALARRLNVKLGFEVVSAERSANQWTVTSRDGQRQQFDKLIWAADLDVAAKAISLPPQLKSTFERIRYQHYYSTLVEIDGLPRSNGVVPKNYRVTARSSIVSWLNRWPSQANAVNFYTLSNEPMAPEMVEARIQSFASENGFKVNKIVRNIGWRYFPHFDEPTLATNPYQVIEASQGREGLFFAGELLNFSTVEHSVAYSKSLIDRFFNRTGARQTAVVLPNNYSSLSARQKLATLWEQVEKTEYDRMPTYADFGDSTLKDILGFLPRNLSGAFGNQNDVIEEGRQKLIHKLGSTATFRFEPANPDYQPYEGLIRLSNAVNPAGGTVYPSFSVKVPLSGTERSINFNIGKSFDGQRIGNDPKGPPDFNFFRDDATYPFSNELPLTPRSSLGRAFKWIFDRAHFTPNYIPIDELTKVMNRAAPRRLIFRAPKPIRDLMDSNVYQEERAKFASINPGSVLFDVYESDGLNDSGRLVGRMITTARFVASGFGDRHLYFRHESRGLRRNPPAVQRGVRPQPQTEPRPDACMQLF